MSTAATKPKGTAAQVLEAMTRLTAQQLDTVMQHAALLRLQKRKVVPSMRESELLQIISRGLNAAKSERLDHLQQKLHDESITSREREQLVRLTEDLEKLAAERLKALIELAALRKTSVSELMTEMGLTEAAYA